MKILTCHRKFAVTIQGKITEEGSSQILLQLTSNELDKLLEWRHDYCNKTDTALGTVMIEETEDSDRNRKSTVSLTAEDAITEFWTTFRHSSFEKIPVNYLNYNR